MFCSHVSCWLTTFEKTSIMKGHTFWEFFFQVVATGKWSVVSHSFKMNQSEIMSPCWKFHVRQRFQLKFITIFVYATSLDILSDITNLPFNLITFHHQQRCALSFAAFLSFSVFFSYFDFFPLPIIVGFGLFAHFSLSCTLPNSFCRVQVCVDMHTVTSKPIPLIYLTVYECTHNVYQTSNGCLFTLTPRRSTVFLFLSDSILFVEKLSMDCNKSKTKNAIFFLRNHFPLA